MRIRQNTQYCLSSSNIKREKIELGREEMQKMEMEVLE